MASATCKLGAFLFAAALACGGAKQGGGGQDDTGGGGSASVGPSGGTVSVRNGPDLQIPANALAADTTITIQQATTPAPDGALTAVYDFEPDGTGFSSPVTVSFPLPAGTTAVSIYWTRPGSTTEFEPIPTTISGTTATAEVWHFSSGYLGPAVSWQSPAYDASGAWRITDTNAEHECLSWAGESIETTEDLSFPRIDTYVQAPGSNSVAVTDGLNGNTRSFTLSGNSFTYSGPYERPGCSRFYMSFQATGDATSGTGTATWLCHLASGAGLCVGRQTLTGTKLELEPPAYEVAGAWNVTDTNIENSCVVPSPEGLTALDPALLSFPRVDTYVQAPGSNSLTVTDGLNGNTYAFTISGASSWYSGPHEREGCQAFQALIEMTANSATTATGTATWICIADSEWAPYPGYYCSGTQALTATKQ
jgi:hypothetical protein